MGTGKGNGYRSFVRDGKHVSAFYLDYTFNGMQDLINMQRIKGIFPAFYRKPKPRAS